MVRPETDRPSFSIELRAGAMGALVGQVAASALSG
jgi:hypothetical protein